MTDTLELEVAIKRARLTRWDVARILKMSCSAFFNKLHNKSEFKASEIVALQKLLQLSNAQRDRIFFTKFVDIKSTN